MLFTSANVSKWKSFVIIVKSAKIKLKYFDIFINILLILLNNAHK